MKADYSALKDKVFRIAIITLSDRASAGTYEDKSGVLMQEMIQADFDEKGLTCSFDYQVIPDDKALFEGQLRKHIQAKTDYIFSTGSTGIGPRDIAPDTIRMVIDKEIPGIMECIRVEFGMQFPNAQLSRSIAGVADQSILYALPGSPKAVKEYLEEIFKTLLHAYLMLHAVDAH
jgi:molybdenum cofactor synthesis domain-containing protein